jgi:hypothetical protein
LLQRTRRTAQTSRWISGSWLGALVAITAACSNDDGLPFDADRRPQANVNVVFDPDVDFSQYRTFAFRDDTEGGGDALAELDPATRGDVELANALVARELRDIGLIDVSDAEADVLAFSVGRTRSATGVQWSCVGGLWGGYWYWDFVYYDPCAWVEADYVELESTTLVVGLLDPELSEVTFAGFARDIGGGPGSRRREILTAVASIFDQYPARPLPSESPDAGAPEVDAGTPDAGASSPDSGLSGDAGAGDAGADASPSP